VNGAAVTWWCCRVQKECYAKCVTKVVESDLAIGEMSCIDRCIPKYFEAHMLVQEEFKAAQQQAMQGMPQQQ
jgi:import inner membrane translocase subunit TIM10